MGSYKVNPENVVSWKLNEENVSRKRECLTVSSTADRQSQIRDDH